MGSAPALAYGSIDTAPWRGADKKPAVKRERVIRKHSGNYDFCQVYGK